MSTAAPPPADTRTPPAPFDPYALNPSEIQDPPRTFSTALCQVGPGLILAGAIVGTGELIATTNLGAQVGFTLLWLVILSCFIKVFVQVELGRHAISSGQTSIASFSRLPGPGLLFVWWFAVMTLVTQFQLGAMIGGVAQAIHMALPAVSSWIAATFPGALGSYVATRPEMPWAVFVTAVTILILANGSYRLVEKSSTVLVVLFTFTTVLCVLLLPAAGHSVPWGEVAGGLSFQLPQGAALLAAFAMFGITGVGASELVAYPYWCIEKGYARKSGPRDDSAEWATRAKGWLSVMRLDAWVSMLVYTLATLSFYFLGAALLHADHSGGLPKTIDKVLETLGGMYAPVLGDRAALVFIVVGAIAVLFSTLVSSTGGNARIFTDTLWVSRLVRLDDHAARRRWIQIFCVACPVLDLFLFAAVGNPVRMVIFGGFAQAVTLPLLAAAAVYLRYKRTDPRLTSGKVWDFFLWLSFAALCAAAAYGLFDVYRKITA